MWATMYVVAVGAGLVVRGFVLNVPICNRIKQPKAREVNSAATVQYIAITLGTATISLPYLTLHSFEQFGSLPRQ
jgi:ABC-type cobalamin transport system permease subunit